MLLGARWRKSSDESSLSRSAKVFERSESARTSMDRTGRSASSRGNGSYVPVTMTDSRFGVSFDPSDCGASRIHEQQRDSQNDRFNRFSSAEKEQFSSTLPVWASLPESVCGDSA